MNINRRIRLLHRRHGPALIAGWQAAQTLSMSSSEFMEWALRRPADQAFELRQRGAKYQVIPLVVNYRADADKAASLVLSAMARIAHANLLANSNVPVEVINLGISTLVARGVLRPPSIHGAESSMEIRFRREAA